MKTNVTRKIHQFEPINVTITLETQDDIEVFLSIFAGLNISNSQKVIQMSNIYNNVQPKKLANLATELYNDVSTLVDR